MVGAMWTHDTNRMRDHALPRTWAHAHNATVSPEGPYRKADHSATWLMNSGAVTKHPWANSWAKPFSTPRNG